MQLWFAATLILQTPISADGAGNWLGLALGISGLGLITAFLFARNVLSADAGTAEMQAISNAIKEGAEAFLRRQYRTIGLLSIVLAVILFVGYKIGPEYNRPFAAKTVIAFLLGAACSALAGFTGMYVSIRTNIRTASAARTSLNRAMQLALRGGAVTGLVVVSLSLLGVGLLFLMFGGLDSPGGTRSAVPDCQVWVWGIFRGAICPVGRRNLRERLLMGADLVGKGRSGDSGRRPA